MVKKDKKIDAYIAKSADFAKPILNHIRELVHKTCPDAEEKMKWSMPFFDYKGEMLCHMAAFKQHAVMSFWKASLMKDPALMENAKSEASMGHLGRLTSLKDLPPDKKIVAWIKEAIQKIKNINQGVTDIDNVPTKHYLKEELQFLLAQEGFEVTQIKKINYPWTTEFDKPPKWLAEPYPWDWMCTAIKKS